MSGVWQSCGHPDCDWSQYAHSLLDGEWLGRTHEHDKHGGVAQWALSSVSGWRPPDYRADATDWLDEIERGTEENTG